VVRSEYRLADRDDLGQPAVRPLDVADAEQHVDQGEPGALHLAVLGAEPGDELVEQTFQLLPRQVAMSGQMR
jgi:hypothetical protein